MEMLGIGLMSFRAIYEGKPQKFEAVLNDDQGRVLHVLVPPLREYLLKGVKAETVYELQKCIEQAALYTTDRTRLSQMSFVPLRTMQNVWLCIANALDLVHGDEDAQEVRQVLGRVMEAAYVGMVEKLPEIKEPMRQAFEVRCSVVFMEKLPFFSDISTTYLVKTLLRSPTVPAGIGELALDCEWPAPVEVKSTQLDSAVRGYHAPMSVLNVAEHPAVNRMAMLCGYSDVGMVLRDLGQKLSPEFSCQRLWGQQVEEVTPEMRKTFGIKE